MKFLTYIPMPMPMPIHYGCGSSVEMPPVCGVFVIACIAFLLLTLLSMITLMIVEGVFSKDVTTKTLSIFLGTPLTLSILCLCASFVCALFGV